MNPLISVIICTHNRAEYLYKTLQSLLDQKTQKDKYEILVVDNLSTDATREVIRKFSKLVKIKYLYEANLGLSFARNTGWRNANGQYVAFLDDDAIASEYWLEKILEAFEDIEPKTGCVGGLVLPIWEIPRPPWLSGWLLHGLSIIDWSENSHFIHNLNEEWLVGTNIAFLKDVLERVGGFTQGLDRAGNNLLSNGDKYIQRQILKAGFSCYYHPKIVVSHHIFHSRLRKKWFVQRYFWQGVSDALMDIIENSSSMSHRMYSAFSKAFSLLKNPMNLVSLISPRDDTEQFKKKCLTLITIGQVAGLLGVVKK